jgi:hypothetical protein
LENKLIGYSIISWQVKRVSAVGPCGGMEQLMLTLGDQGLCEENKFRTQLGPGLNWEYWEKVQK